MVITLTPGHPQCVCVCTPSVCVYVCVCTCTHSTCVCVCARACPQCVHVCVHACAHSVCVRVCVCVSGRGVGQDQGRHSLSASPGPTAKAPLGRTQPVTHCSPQWTPEPQLPDGRHGSHLVLPHLSEPSSPLLPPPSGFGPLCNHSSSGCLGHIWLQTSDRSAHLPTTASPPPDVRALLS